MCIYAHKTTKTFVVLKRDIDLLAIIEKKVLECQGTCE